ncbi:MAG: RIP metalloprotease RseP [Phycisphaerae bacterium]|nr:RIP metalloprotease RseP [Phycisphaerae bacterium]
MPDLLSSLSMTGGALLAASPLANIWQAVWPYLLMVLGFSIIIFVHELGHFAAAKWAGVKVDRFAIGFGRELFGFTYGETRYSFNILPLGGYVKMLGQEDFDDKSNELLFSDDPRSFVNKPVLHRMVIVSAGVIMNVLFACALFMIIFMIGMPAITTRIGYVEPDSPADKAGLLPGDQVVSINGKRVLDFNIDLTTAIALAPPHERIQFRVKRNGEMIEPVFVKPDFRRPENTRQIKRQVIGIAPGSTREIYWVGPSMDPTRPDHPHVGDMIVEVNGTPVTDDNIDRVKEMLAYSPEVYVERKDPKNPDAPPKRVKVDIPPQLVLFPADSSDPASISLLGLTPLARFGTVDRDSRAELAGIEVGDTVLSFDDRPYPTYLQINQAIRQNPEFDIPFLVRKSDGKVVSGFVRPKTNRFGAATIQADWDGTDDDADTSTESPKDSSPASADHPLVQFTAVRPGGVADKAGIRVGDEVLSVNDTEHPSASKLSSLIHRSSGKAVSLELRRPGNGIVSVTVWPIPPGAIDATFTFVANDVLRTAAVVRQIHGKTTPAAEANIPTGAAITSVDDKKVSTWVELINAFRERAGKDVLLAYDDVAGKTHTVPFHVPRSLRTILGVGPEARIISIDGRETVVIKTRRGEEEVHVGYHEGTEHLLESLVGQRNVPVVYRPTPIAAPLTAYIDVTEDMTDPWLGRVAFAPGVDILPETIILKGKNVVDAISIGMHKTWSFILQVYLVIKRMVFSDTVGVENMSGPLGIISMGSQIAQTSFVQFLYFMAIISANLAVINFLPLPIVDGGLMVFLIIEKIKGSPVSLKVQVATQMIGLFLIIGAFLFVTYNDVMRIWG